MALQVKTVPVDDGALGLIEKSPVSMLSPGNPKNNRFNKHGLYPVKCFVHLCHFIKSCLLSN